MSSDNPYSSTAGIQASMQHNQGQRKKGHRSYPEKEIGENIVYE